MAKYLLPTALILTISSPVLSLWAAPASELWPYWQSYNAQNTAHINHSGWQNFLGKNVKDSPSLDMYAVDYKNVSAADKKMLAIYIQETTAIDPRQYNRAEQLAYWINLYNALTVDLILKNYPVQSITKLGDSWFAVGPWNDPITTVAGQKITLNDIEHRILRPIWNDPRIHYGLNCASIGCPDLLPHAYTGQNSNQLLDLAGERFVNAPKGVTFNGSELELSKIYNWYGVDFGSNQLEILAEIAKFAEPVLQQRLLGYNGSIDYQYDWDLNQYQP